MSATAPTTAQLDWQTPPAELAWERDEAHVWRAFLDHYTAAAPQFQMTLSEDEQSKAGRFHFERDRIHYTITRALLRSLLGRYLHVAPGHLRFIYGTAGKPALEPSPDALPLHFNVSHAHGMALFAFTREGEIGIDLERVRPLEDSEQLAKNFFSAREQTTLRELPTAQRAEAFFNGWTRKEAYLKATGLGISDTLSQVEVTLVPGEPARLLSFGGDVQAASAWQLLALAPAPGFVGALAYQGAKLELACWQCPE